MSVPDNKETVPSQDTEVQEKQDSWASKPQRLGDSAGEKIEGTLSPVGKHVGKGLETVARPVGGIVDPTVGSIMRMGKGWGEQLGVGYGNYEGGPAKQEEAEGQRMKEPFGGKEQNADNPLGL
ncbi:uncharacterized protein Z519_12143 [Cladophialophora bantiana CBS 173.52]|uniref:Uncharacterized protein n=1 Tax=Cladophialophora bantiana (strain ATCC 10958 / CBS 173.52 / CDC B-1940 / NIH 8579) TaxID=1442370 RepID=A0A0D2H8L6_CLAB1|nr:uncharacterized protein Z519_12143 [Cladophialophora bantiana CBS 173.52]KIW87240.1 hypothetical protein Z519_12143 [Cladophialophora bantiana CBS 173.52]